MSMQWSQWTSDDEPLSFNQRWRQPLTVLFRQLWLVWHLEQVAVLVGTMCYIRIWNSCFAIFPDKLIYCETHYHDHCTDSVMRQRIASVIEKLEQLLRLRSGNTSHSIDLYRIPFIQCQLHRSLLRYNRSKSLIRSSYAHSVRYND